MMNRKTLTSLAFLLLSFNSLSASLSTNQALADSLKQYVKENEPGCALAYGNATNDIFHSKGIIEVGKSHTITSDTPFLTASISKQFTAHLAILLAKSNQLILDGAIQHYFPEIDTNENITINDLMNNTSGIPDHWAIFELQGRALTEKYTQQDALALLKNNLSLQFNPGDEYKYSNGGYVALTQVIENVSKKKLNELLNRQINIPLDINAQYIDDPKRLPAHRAKGHIQTKAGFRAYAGESYIYGDSNLMINALDFSKWAKYLNQQLVSLSEYSKALSTSAKNNHYFAGLYLESDNTGKQFLQHSGYYENYTQSIVLIPESQEYALSLCNRADFKPSNILYSFLSEIGALSFKDTLPPESATPQPKLTSSLYINAEKTDIAMIISEGQKLYYYGQLVSSPKRLKAAKNNSWNAELSTSKVIVKAIEGKKIQVSNRQNTYNYRRIDINSNTPFKEVVKQTYTNPTIGIVEFSYAQVGELNFVDSVGAIPLKCSIEKFCWSEDGYVVVNIKTPQEIIISTNDLKKMKFLKMEG